MTPRRQRMLSVAIVVIGVAVAAGFALRAFNEDLLFFYSPRQIVAGEAPENRTFRVGGLVIDGSVEREPGSLEVRFVLTDNAHDVPVSYSGVLPDLFREGQGIIAHGQIRPDGLFVADTVLAKHDENYMPPEVAESLKEVHQRASGGET